MAQEQATRRSRMLAITGGKGGVGKTSIAVNLALTLARDGQRVLLLDGDTDLANVSIMLGQYPNRTLEQALNGSCSLEEVILEAPHGLHVIPGASGMERCMAVSAADRTRLLEALAALESNYDTILIDTAAGLQPVVLHMIAAADQACVVVTPDPASLTDAFSLLKVLHRRGYRRQPSVLINMARGASQARSLFQRFAAAVQRYLGITPHYLGAIWRDETLVQAARQQRPVALLPASDPSARQFRVLADMVSVKLTQAEPRPRGFAGYWQGVAQRRAASQPTQDSASLTTPIAARWQAWVSEFEALLAASDTTSTQIHDAIIACMASLGRAADDDVVETLQTGLANLGWESWPEAVRGQFAEHLRHLAEQVQPRSDVSSPAVMPVSGTSQGVLPAADEPRYDRVRFGDQSKLLAALKEQPRDVSVERFLRSVLEKTSGD
ncbi:MAG: AAA family ATPase [Marinobacter sp.]|nr:AAA family ATPase [Marinobacter sp.]